jgi:hypothetical protein
MAIFAVSAVMSASASASYIIEGTEIAESETVEFTGSSQGTKLEGSLAGASLRIGCTESIAPASSTNVLEAFGGSKNKYELRGCTIAENSKGTAVPLTACSVKEPVDAEFTGELGPDEEELIGSGAEETAAEVEIKEASCALHGKYKLKGVESCSILNEEIELTIHHMVCLPVESGLKLGTEASLLFMKPLVALGGGRQGSMRSDLIRLNPSGELHFNNETTEKSVSIINTTRKQVKLPEIAVAPATNFSVNDTVNKCKMNGLNSRATCNVGVKLLAGGAANATLKVKGESINALRRTVTSTVTLALVNP